MSESEDETSSAADWPVTEEWLQAVLRQHHKDLEQEPTAAAAATSITVLDFTVKPGCGGGESVLSDILAVVVRYTIKKSKEDGGGHGDDASLAASGPHHLSFVVKLLPQDPFSRFFVTEAQFDLREIKFYTQVRVALDAKSRSKK